MTPLLAKLFGKKPADKSPTQSKKSRHKDTSPKKSSMEPQVLQSPMWSTDQQRIPESKQNMNIPAMNLPTKQMMTPTDLQSRSEARAAAVTVGGENVLRNLGSFQKLKMLGEGTFGRVYLVRNKGTKLFYALKVMKKSTIVRLKQVSHVHNERNILAAVDSPFVVKLHATFQDTENLYLVMEFMIGGELFHHLRSKGKFPLDVTIFYAAEIITALADLHDRKIVYRDLKPENIMIGKDGHVKLCDFGFAKFVTDRTWTLCGTPEYLAPEVIQGEGHNQAADWWSLGILIYELLAGYPPFYDPNPVRIYDQVLSGVLRFPPDFGPITRSLLTELLCINKSRRLGNLAGGYRDVMNHDFFRHVNWEAVRRKQLAPPWIPPIRHAGDTIMFSMWDTQVQNAMDVDEEYSAPDVQIAQQQAVDAATAQFGASHGYGRVDETEALFRGF